jgi:hypothetical protein
VEKIILPNSDRRLIPTPPLFHIFPEVLVLTALKPSLNLRSLQADGQCKVHHRTGHDVPEKKMYRFRPALSIISALDGWLYTPEKDPVPIVQEAGWAPRRVRKISPPPEGIRSPDPPVHNSVAIPTELSRSRWEKNSSHL